MKIGIVAETESQNDARVALTPADAKHLLDRYTFLQIAAQPSAIRTFNDNDYRKLGIEITNDLSTCDLILGVKEVNINAVIPEKTYLFFAHVGKEQSYHQQYFQQLAHKKITLIDYEYFTDNENKRITAFGFEAGIVGTYYAIDAIKRKLNRFVLPAIEKFNNHQQLIDQLQNASISAVKILISGTGLTAGGVTYLLDKIGFRRINKTQFLNQNFMQPVYCQLKLSDYLQSYSGEPYTKKDFRKNPSNYTSNFNRFAVFADVYIACHYWEKGYPGYLSNNDLKNINSKLKIIADISCDLNGPIASTIRESTHQMPFYDYNPNTCSEEIPFSSRTNISVMTVGNLPTALAREASVRFSKSLVEKILPGIIEKKKTERIQHATLLKKGVLSSRFSYLYNFLNEK